MNPSSSIKFRQSLCVAACVLLLSACATTEPVKVVAPPTVAEMMAKAGAASNAGQKEAAIELWKQTATAFPADKEPWLRIAQTRYDAGQYGDAIINAQEVLLRDPADRVANSIVAISGLRLSTRALSDLSRQNNLSGSLRTESQDLAKLLRESLGETVLVPPKAAPAPAARNRGRAAPKPAASNDDSSANPFDGLK
ncbi:lipoprotein [Janthinobacterium agaricidamnosum]|uniref:Tetratricopeptide repeat family protein n=1 Tax=Janthinobacterium agaricidamnosum NBRC 102515 = DSM 9628 TaxID=1349767 RepID=W0V6F2_9BURK|nr:lipoprotein [Janthinobacterium agaricidamnosum]CDG83190.1 tetratricopeptide repeat family protein [Janthinobacterium agaricidamnosum NBRC 102515 = DSM 9628]